MMSAVTSLDVESLFSLILSAFILCAIPGPAIVALCTIARTRTTLETAQFNVGIVTGLTLCSVFSAMGLASLLVMMPGFAKVLNILAAGYFTYLAWTIATARPAEKKTDISPTLNVLQGIVMGLMNPKGYVVFFTLFGTYSIAPHAPATDMSIKIGVIFLVLVIVCTAWMAFGIFWGRSKVLKTGERTINFVLASFVLVTATLPLFFSS
ncbi:MAG: LysE family transporter [Paracoccaceae bacterium]